MPPPDPRISRNRKNTKLSTFVRGDHYDGKQHSIGDQDEDEDSNMLSDATSSQIDKEENNQIVWDTRSDSGVIQDG